MIQGTFQMRGKVTYCGVSKKGETFATVIDASDQAGRYPQELSVKLPEGDPAWIEGQIGDLVIVGEQGSFRDPKSGQTRITWHLSKVQAKWYAVKLEPVKSTASEPR